jgi:hypothetical protein
MPEPPGQKNDHEAESQNMGTQQDHTVTQSHFSALGLPEEEYPDGTVLIWRFDELPAAYAMRDERLARVAGYGDARWWTPKGAATWDQLREIASGNPPPIVLKAWGTFGLRASESASAMLARLGTDAQLWAREFIERFGGDEHLLLTWFASAIETGRSAGYARGRDDQMAGIGAWPPGSPAEVEQ